MITKRIIPCLDVKDGRVVKGVNFLGLRDVSSPVDLAAYYSDSGADELVFYDITASAEGRKLFIDILREVASGAIRDPELVRRAARRYGDQCVVLSVDVKRMDGEFRVFARGGRDDTGIEAISWIRKCVDMGAGEVVVNSIDTDGVKGGFDLEMLQAVCESVSVPVIASGGAGCSADFTELFRKVPDVSAGLAASIFHFGEVKIPELKAELRANGINVRL